MSNGREYGNKATDWTVAVVEHLAARLFEPVSLRQLAADLGLKEATAHGVLTRLEKAGWVRQYPGGGYGLETKGGLVGIAATLYQRLREAAGKLLT